MTHHFLFCSEPNLCGLKKLIKTESRRENSTLYLEQVIGSMAAVFLNYLFCHSLLGNS